MTQTTSRGFGPVLANRNFRALWFAQLLAQTSQHAIHFIQMVLIEKLTGSAMHLGLIILAFSLPGVIFSPIAGVAVDRFPKKLILVGSNLIRVFLALSYIAILNLLSGTWELVAIYTVTFLMATLAQFFAPAEAATIPLLVGEDLLLPANSLFTLTMAISQVIGLLILGPLVTSLLQVQGGFILIAIFYLGATLAVSTLPMDRRPAGQHQSVAFGWQQVWPDFREGWHFVTRHRKIQAAMAQLVTVATLVMVMAMIAPGYAARVLGINAENAVIVFAPAGIGMLLATGIVGRWGYRLRRIGFGPIGLVLAGLTFAAMGWVALDYQRLLQPILHVYPKATFSLTSATMVLGLLLGMSLASVNILGQTTLQQESPPNIRGRVFSVQFMLNNLIGIPPMLVLGGMADAIGIPGDGDRRPHCLRHGRGERWDLTRARKSPRTEPAPTEPTAGVSTSLPGPMPEEARPSIAMRWSPIWTTTWAAAAVRTTATTACRLRAARRHTTGPGRGRLPGNDRGRRCRGAQLLIVHHGLFWGKVLRVVGPHRRRVQALGRRLFPLRRPSAAGPPPRGGQQRRTGALLGLTVVGGLGEAFGLPVGVIATATTPRTALVARLAASLGVTPLVLPGGPEQVQRIGIISAARPGTSRPRLRPVATPISPAKPATLLPRRRRVWRQCDLRRTLCHRDGGAKALAAHLDVQFALPSTFIDRPTGL